jgi:hypothetical protein
VAFARSWSKWSTVGEKSRLVDDRADVARADPADPRLEASHDAGGAACDHREVLDLTADDGTRGHDDVPA